MEGQSRRRERPERPLPSPAPVCRPRLLSLALVATVALTGCSLGDDAGRPPQLGAKSDDEEAAAKLGFPSSATKNTVRVGGGDTAADVAGVASAVFPSTQTANRPTAVVLLDQDNWQAGVVASALASPPIGGAFLLSSDGDLPAVSQDTLDRLDPKGSDLSKDAQVIRIGEDVPRPSGLKTAAIEGDNPFELAAAVDRFQSAAKGRPSKNVVIASGERPEWAMPAGAWAAFSGDSVLLTQRNTLPPATRRAIQAHERPGIYIMGNDSVVSKRVEDELKKLGRVVRIQGPTPVQNAIAFSRYAPDGKDFGWRTVTAGSVHTVASTERPNDVVGAAMLTARGVPAPLLLTNRADRIPPPLESALLSVQPGFDDDRRDVAYNRTWVLGDDRTISVAAQAKLDQITELIPVQVNAP